MEDLTGRQFGTYQIIEPLGEGGMAAVYKAYQPSVDRYVALKVLPKHFAEDPSFIARFEQEAKVLAKLQHPHILPIHDYGTTDGYTYMAMPLVKGGELTAILYDKRLSLAETNKYISQIGDALDYAHSQGVVHRDIKPSNVLMDQRGNCLLTDFGIAKIVEGASSERLTLTGHVIGTPTYMSPEQGMGKKLDGRSDIYALGVILYEMVTGEAPYQAETPMAIVVKHIHDPLPPPRKVDPNIPESIERVVLKSMAKNPNDRFATAGEMVKALQNAVQSATSVNAAVARPVDDKTRLGSGYVAKTKTPAKATKKSDSNQMMLWAIIATVVLILLAGLALGGLFLFSRSQQAAPPLPTEPAAEQPAPMATPFELPTAVPPVETSLPTPSPTPVVQPTEPPATAEAPPPTQVPPPEQPPDQQQQPPDDQPPTDQRPPLEAFEACSGAAEGAACTVQTPRGAINGTCISFVNRLACVPEGGPPPRDQ